MMYTINQKNKNSIWQTHILLDHITSNQSATMYNEKQVGGGLKTQLLVDLRFCPVPGSCFRTIETGRNRTETPVNRRLGFEVVPRFWSCP